MKKLILAGAVALFGLSNAQIAKGTTYVSGVVGYTSDKDNNADKTVSNFSIVPTVGYFVGTNLAVGLGVGYESGKTQTETSESVTIANVITTTSSSNEVTSNKIVVEPFVRKYWTLSDKLYFFGQLSVPMEFGSGKVEGGSTTTITDNNVTPPTVTTTSTTVSEDTPKYNSFGVSVKPGLDYFLNKNWTIEATIGEFGYNTKKYDIEGAKSTDKMKFGLNLASVNIGVKYVFGK